MFTEVSEPESVISFNKDVNLALQNTDTSRCMWNGPCHHRQPRVEGRKVDYTVGISL